MNSADVSTLKKELDRFKPKPCRSCQLILGFGVLVFLVSLTLFLFALQGVRPAILPVAEIPRETQVTRVEQKAILDDLRVFAQTKQTRVPGGAEEEEAQAARKIKRTIVVDPLVPAQKP